MTLGILLANNLIGRKEFKFSEKKVNSLFTSTRDVNYKFEFYEEDNSITKNCPGAFTCIGSSQGCRAVWEDPADASLAHAA